MVICTHTQALHVWSSWTHAYMHTHTHTHTHTHINGNMHPHADASCLVIMDSFRGNFPLLAPRESPSDHSHNKSRFTARIINMEIRIGADT